MALLAQMKRMSRRGADGARKGFVHSGSAEVTTAMEVRAGIPCRITLVYFRR